MSIHPQTGRYTVYTGFLVIHDAVEYVWTVDVYGPGDDDHEFDWGGPLLFHKKWSGHKSTSIHNNGKFSALVTHPAFAILYDGAICTSAHPSASAYVYTY